MDAKLKKRLQAAEVAIAQALALAPAVAVVRPADMTFQCCVEDGDWIGVESDPGSVMFDISGEQVVLNREATRQLRDWLTQFLEATDGQEN